MNLLRLCAHPQAAAKMCMLELLDLLALHNMKGGVHAVNRKPKRTEMAGQNPV